MLPFFYGIKSICSHSFVRKNLLPLDIFPSLNHPMTTTHIGSRYWRTVAYQEKTHRINAVFLLVRYDGLGRGAAKLTSLP